MLYQRFPLILALLLCVFPVFSQEEIKEKPPKNTFSCLIWERTELPTLYYRYQNHYLPIKLYPGTRSPQYALQHPQTEDGKFWLYTEIEVEGETKYKPYAGVDLPSFDNRILLLLFPTNDPEKPPLRMLALDDSVGTFSAGSYKLYNLSRKAVQITYNGGKKMLSPKAITIVKPDIPEKGGLLPFVVNSRKERIFDSRIFSQPNDRSIVFIFPETRPNQKRSLRVRFLSELIPPPPPPKK